MTNITSDQARKFATLALNGLQREYPNKITHLLNIPSDVGSPKTLHPAFYGCWDVHSSIHAHWLVVRVLRLFPDHVLAPKIRRVLNENLTKNNIQVEIDYFRAPNRQAFERPYGWAWILKLQAEIESFTKKYDKDSDAIAWRNNLKPLSQYIVERFEAFLKNGQYPNRVGVQTNTAFALYLAIDYATITNSASFLNLLHKSVQKFYVLDNDMNNVASLEPNEDDFLSPTLMEAALVSQVQNSQQFSKWFSSFYPSLPKNILKPVRVVDKKDPKLVHHDGLNLSRAWCLSSIARKLQDGPGYGQCLANATFGSLLYGTRWGPSEDRASIIKTAAKTHLQVGLENVESGEYSGEHWLGTFAVLALTE